MTSTARAIRFVAVPMGATFVTGLAAAGFAFWGAADRGLSDAVRFLYWLVPFSIVLAVVAWLYVALSAGLTPMRRLMLAPVAALLGGSLAAVLLAVLLASDASPFRSPEVFCWLLASVAGVYGALFERRRSQGAGGQRRVPSETTVGR